jgi:ADP-L-glycero-D-manno-heptose 6-epimerase
VRILITGNKGFIGQNLVQRFTNHDLYFYDWDPLMFPEVEGFDWVIHLGANSNTTERDIEKIMVQNYDFSKRLYNECTKYNVNLQYASSASVYGNTQDFSVNAKKSPMNPYAWTKFLFDRWVNEREHSIIVQGFRYFNVYGPNESHKRAQASPYTKFINQAIETKEVTVFENSENYKRDFIHVQDVCDIHKRMLDVNQSGIWNVGTGKATSFLEVANAVCEKYGATIKYISMPDSIKNQYQTYTCADIRLMKSLFDKEYIDIIDCIKND